VRKITYLDDAESHTLVYTVMRSKQWHFAYLAEAEVNGVQYIVASSHTGYKRGGPDTTIWRLVENTSSSSAEDPNRKKQMNEEGKDDSDEKYRLELIKESSFYSPSIQMMSVLNDGTLGLIRKSKFTRRDLMDDHISLSHNSSGFQLLDFRQLSDGTIVAARNYGDLELFRWDVRFGFFSRVSEGDIRAIRL